MGSVGEKEQMNEMPNAQLSTPNVELSTSDVTSSIRQRTPGILRRILDFVVAGVFLYAGVIKALDPVQFANDIDNYKLLAWPISVALAFYLPWLEIFCGLALIVRLLYRGALSLLTLLTVIFTVATIAARVRGLDITCGCFGHASQHWSFPAHLGTNLAILAALLALLFKAAPRNRLQRAV
jgi:putative oxidoreductase